MTTMHPERFRVAGTTGRILVSGDLEQAASLDAEGFFQDLLRLPHARAIDLIRIAAGVYVVDRIVKRRGLAMGEEGSRRLHLDFEVSDPSFWKRDKISSQLRETLTFLSGDDWSFGFGPARPMAHQTFLGLPPFPAEHAALMSEGLDSAAGLATRLLSGDNRFMLVTIGHQTGMHRRVTRQIHGLARLLKSAGHHPVVVLHSTLAINLQKGKAERTRRQELTQRTRAFLFCVAAAVAAREYRLENVEMFENGVGSVNLPLMSGMLSAVHSTRGAHPTFLSLMSELVSRVVDARVAFALPFDAQTKAEMVAGLKAVPGMSEWLQRSQSCVHGPMREPGKKHCGTCPACIERRQAFAAASIEEKASLYKHDILRSPPRKEEEFAYFELYRHESSQWIARAGSSIRRMDNHLRLTDVPPLWDRGIYELQDRHAREIAGVFG